MHLLRSLRYFRAPLVGAFVLALTAPVLAVAPSAMDSAAEVSERLRYRLEVAQRDGVLQAGEGPILARAAVQRFYLERDFAPAWTGRGSGTNQADTLLRILLGAHDHGLSPADYAAAALDASLKAYRARPSLAAQADLELRLTDAALLYATHLRAGRVNPTTIDSEWFANMRGGDTVALLQQALAGGDLEAAYNRWAPQDPRYARLQAALRELSAAADPMEGVPPLPAGLTLRPGQNHPAVRVLRTRLGDPGDSPEFDASLTARVKAWQAERNLTTDGVIGAQSRRLLNQSMEEQVGRLRVNLERWRWMPDTLEGRRIEVNIPDFRLHAYAPQQAPLEMNVIVGKAYRRTPVFSGRMSYLVLNPYWEAPRKLVVEDLVPKFRANPALAQSMGFEALKGWGEAQVLVPDVDWSRYARASSFPYRLRQRPGPQNAMGRVKFMFPNPHAVYLHDTAHPELFAQQVRTMSSGCVRVQDPRALYAWLMGSDDGWPREPGAPVDRSRGLRERVPVHLQYWTAWVDDAGRLQTRADVYERDQRVLDALNSAAPRHLE